MSTTDPSYEPAAEHLAGAGATGATNQTTTGATSRAATEVTTGQTTEVTTGTTTGAATEAAGSTTPRKRPSSRRGLPAILGLITALLVGAAGGWYVHQTPTVYSASRTVVVVPATSVTVDQSASLYDSLSRGQVVATAAQLLGQPRWHPDTPDVTVSAGDVAPSSLVMVTARGSDQGQVTAALDQVVDTATPRINELVKPYVVSPVDTSAAQVKKVGLSTTLMLLVALLAALLAGLAVAALAARLLRRAA